MSDTHPDAACAVAMSALEEGIGLERARHALKMRLVHGNDGMTEEQIKNRRTILTIAIGLIAAERDKKIDEALAQWQSYKRLSSV